MDAINMNTRKVKAQITKLNKKYNCHISFQDDLNWYAHSNRFEAQYNIYIASLGWSYFTSPEGRDAHVEDILQATQ